MWNAVYMVRNLDLGPLDKWLLVALASYGKPDGTGCHPGTKRLAQDTGISERKVQYTLRTLESKGLISSVSLSGGRGVYTSYDVHLEPTENGAPHAPITDVETVHHMHPLPQKGAHKRVHGLTQKGARIDTKGCTDVQVLPAVPNEQELKQELKQEGVRTPARQRGGIQADMPAPEPAHIDANGRAPARETSPLDTPMTADDPQILEIYRGYWEEFFEPFYRTRLTAPKSEWGFNKYLEAHGRNIWSVYPEAELAKWQPAYRSFCVHLSRIMKERVTA